MLIVKGVDTVVLHNYKCAGTSIYNAIVSTYSKVRWNCHHASITALPSIYKDYRRIGFCRNPTTCYTSYYHHFKFIGKHRGCFLEPMGIVSDSFNLSFSKTLDRVLDLRNFFDMNKDYLNKYHKQIALLRNSCTSLLNFPDAYGVTAEDFEDTLYKHSYITLGLDTANVYKMDDGNLQEYLDYEFPGTTLRVLNKRRSATTELLESSKDLSRIAKADEYFMNKYKYTL